MFAPSRREQMRLRMALQGPPSAGKTFTAFTLARALSPDGRFAVIDTEKRALEYACNNCPERSCTCARLFQFGHVAPTAADPEQLPRMFAAAAAEGYGALVIDSFTHYWSGNGGALDRVDRKHDKRAGWSEYRPVENAMMAGLLTFPGHVIVTMRVKVEYVTETNERGKTVTRRVGLKADQRDSVDYEFSIIGEMDTDHGLTVVKSTCADLVDRRIERPGLDLADTLRDWLGQGDPVADLRELRDRAVNPRTTFAELGDMFADAERRPYLLDALVIDEHGDETTYGNLLRRLGRERKPVQLATAAKEAAA